MGAGLELVPVEPMRRWRVRFNGELVDKDGVSHNVEIDAQYSSNLPYFDFDSDMDPWPVCRAMAREQWSGDYFR